MEIKWNRQAGDVPDTLDIAHGLRLAEPQFF